jgi:hypothetical protein
MTFYPKFVALFGSVLLLSKTQAVINFHVDADISIPNTYEGISIDLETGNSSTSINGLSGGDANFFYGGARISNDADASAATPSWQPVRTGTGNTDAVQQLSVGTTVGPETDFYSSGFGASGQLDPHIGSASGFTDGTPGYLGFSLVIDDPLDAGTPLTIYGWARVTLQDNNGVGTLHEWAYDDSGESIQVGVIPEPSSSAFVILAITLAMLKRRSR